MRIILILFGIFQINSIGGIHIFCIKTDSNSQNQQKPDLDKEGADNFLIQETNQITTIPNVVTLVTVSSDTSKSGKEALNYTMTNLVNLRNVHDILYEVCTHYPFLSMNQLQPSMDFMGAMEDELEKIPGGHQATQIMDQVEHQFKAGTTAVTKVFHDVESTVEDGISKVPLGKQAMDSVNQWTNYIKGNTAGEAIDANTKNTEAHLFALVRMAAGQKPEDIVKKAIFEYTNEVCAIHTVKVTFPFNGYCKTAKAGKAIKNVGKKIAKGIKSVGKKIGKVFKKIG